MLVINIAKIATLKIIVVHAPTSASDDEEIERFYDKLEEIVRRKSTFTIILGDFNAKLGEREGSEQYIGNFGLGKRNERGRRLADFAESAKLYVMNSFFTRNPGSCCTWRSPNDTTRNGIDYVLTDKRRLVTDVAVISESAVSVLSDHRLLRAKVAFDFQAKERIRRKAFYPEKPRQFAPDLFFQPFRDEKWDISDSDINMDYYHLIKKLEKCKAAAAVNVVKQPRNRLCDATIDLLRKRRRRAAKGSTGLE
ncbi:Craniofacial development protein 2, partial [Toxocara canis]